MAKTSISAGIIAVVLCFFAPVSFAALSITTQPKSVTNYIGQPDTCSVAVSGGSAVHYQWFRDGAASGADAAVYSTSALAKSDNGSKVWVRCSDGVTTVVSDTAFLTVFDSTMAIYAMYGYEE